MIAICPNPFRDTDFVYTRRARKLLQDAGFATAVCPVFADEEPNLIPEDLHPRKITEVASACKSHARSADPAAGRQPRDQGLYGVSGTGGTR